MYIYILLIIVTINIHLYRDEVKEYFDAETAEYLSHLLPH